MRHLVEFIGVIVWIAGIVLAKGFWSTLFAVILPFWSWIVVASHLIHTL